MIKPLMVVLALIQPANAQWAPSDMDPIANMLMGTNRLVAKSATAGLCGQRTYDWSERVSKTIGKAFYIRREEIAKAAHIPVERVKEFAMGVMVGQAAGAASRIKDNPQLCQEIAKSPGGWAAYLAAPDVLAK